jgi:hypothetical protein
VRTAFYVLGAVAAAAVVGLLLLVAVTSVLRRFPSRSLPHANRAEAARVRFSCRPHPVTGGSRNGLAEAVRTASPIHAFVGANGGGKTLAMVHATLPTLAGIAWSCDNPAHAHTARGVTSGQRRVLSTVQLLDPATGDPHPLCDLFTDYRQLLDLEHADVLMDEVTGVASSRQSQSLPVQVENLLVQLRRRDVVLRWTSPDFARADKVMREVTQHVTYCSGSMPAPRSADGRLWRERRLFLWTTFAGSDFEDFTVSKRERLKPEARQWFWRPGCEAERVYSTLAGVAALGVATDGGMCLHCGGQRSRPRCACPSTTLLGDGVVEVVDARGTRRRSRTAAATGGPAGAAEDRTAPPPGPVEEPSPVPLHPVSSASRQTAASSAASSTTAREDLPAGTGRHARVSLL